MVGLRVNVPRTPTNEGTAMKTVPTIRVADTTDAVVLPDLPEEIALVMTDVAGAAREGFLALSAAAGGGGAGPAGSPWGAAGWRWVGRGRAPWMATRCRGPATPPSPPRTC